MPFRPNRLKEDREGGMLENLQGPILTESCPLVLLRTHSGAAFSTYGDDRD
jgi:hypothetical protein